MDETVSFSSWLKARRRALDMTQVELADRVGCTTATIKKIEQDERRPSREIAERMAEALELPLAEHEAFVQSARGLRAADRLTIPPLPAQGTSPAVGGLLSNLPVQPMPLIGREREVTEVATLLRHPGGRVLTLTGPGGIGKTRLALQAVMELRDHFPDGVSFVDLAPISDPALVLPTLAQTLGLKETGEQPLLETLVAYLRDRRLLVLLDNFEQVVAAAPLIAALLARASCVQALVTSRAPLHLLGEREFAVPPLALPDPRRLDTVEQVTQSAAAAFFIARAQAIKPDFAVTPANARAIAALCTRLDGLPLAIELAAARTRLFSPEALLARLEAPLTFLTGGARDLPARQQTIRNTIAWSYDLLDPTQQRLFRRLAVFVGGWTIEAADAVCNAGGDLGRDVLEGLTALVEQSLMRPVAGGAGEPRFRQLELIRAFAVEQLEASGEAAEVRQQHALYALRLVEAAAAALQEGADQVTWFERLEAEHDNLRTALQWTLDQQEVTLALRLASSLREFWLRRGYLTEGRRWLEAALVASSGDGAVAASLRAKVMLATAAVADDQGDWARGTALYQQALPLVQELGNKPGIAAALAGLARSAHGQGDYHRAAELYEQQLALDQDLGNRRGVASALGQLGYMACDQGDYARGYAMLEESLALRRELGDKDGVVWALFSLGVAAYHQGDFTRAAGWLAESLPLAQELGDPTNTASVLVHLGSVAGYQGAMEEAERLLQEGLALYQKVGARHAVGITLRYQGKVAQEQGDWARATALYREGLAVQRELGRKWEIAACLEGLAGVAAGQDQPGRAARLWGAAEAIREQIGAPLPPAEHARYAAAVAHARAALGEHAFEAAWAEGRALPLEQVITDALKGRGEAL